MAEAPVRPADHAAPVERAARCCGRSCAGSTLLVLLLVGTILYGVSVSPAFWRSDTLFYVGLNMGEVAIMALPVALIVITGEIDLSIAAILGLTGVVMAESSSTAGRSGWRWPPRSRREPVRRVQRLPRHRARPAVARRHDRDADALPRDRAGDPPDRHDRRLPERPSRTSACSRSTARRSLVGPLLRDPRARGRRRAPRDAARALDLRDRRRRRRPRSSPASA